jgi:uncharacterized protein (DUF58 family)
MAGAALTASGLPAQRELTAFARAAGRWLATSAPHVGEARSARRERGAGLLFLEHRDYQPGDDVRRISWPLTLRHGRPVLRELEAERRADWLVCVDASSSMAAAGAAKWCYARHLAAAMTYALLEIGSRVALALFADGVLGACPAGRGAAQYLHVSRLLSCPPPARRGAGTVVRSCIPRLAGASSALVISDFLTAASPGADLAGFAARCAETHAIQVTDRRELQLPPRRTLELIDVESGEQLTWLAARSDERTAAAATARTRALARTCAAAGVTFSAAEVSTPWQRALLRHLADRAAAGAACLPG